MPNEHSFDVRIGHTSPLFTALPLTGDRATGWTTRCNATGYPCDGLGQSSVSTAKADATMSLNFWGSRIELRGRLIGGMSLDWELDGSSQSPNGEQVSKEGSVTVGEPLDPELLAVFEGLDSSKVHTLKFTTRASLPSASMSFKGAVVTVGTGITGGVMSMTYLDDDNPALEYSQTPGGWARYGEYESPDFNITQPEGVTNRKFQSTKVPGESVTMNFNGTQVLIYGPCYSSNGAYAITLDQEALVVYNASSNAYSAPNAASVAGACLRYMSPPLAPDSLHYISMANADQGRETNLDWVLIVGESGGQSISSGENQKKHNVSAIVGAVVGSVALLLALAALWCVLRYRRRRVRTVDIRASSRDSSDEHKTKTTDLLSSESSIPRLLDGEQPKNVTSGPSHASGNSLTFQRVEPFELPPLVDNARPPKTPAIPSQPSQLISAPHDSTISIPMVQMTTPRLAETSAVSSPQTPVPPSAPDTPIPITQPISHAHFTELAAPSPSVTPLQDAARPHINQPSPSHANSGTTVDLSQISSDVNRILAQLGQIRQKAQAGYPNGDGRQTQDDISEGEPPEYGKHRHV
ncbi:unnamed protein product [Rhizoctonia solani]|uniref:Uncharacterized protein n=1 Tax=Rhizoctonia solani TaxID=456999 RepID=A0A8H3A8J9_9AGAM|nr:unnamed protein product [Rhizoctonia solani]